MVTSRILFGDDADVIRDKNFQVLILANLITPLGTALISPMINSLTGPFGTSEASIGLLMTVFIAPGIVLIPLAGVLADLYGRRIVLVSGLVLVGIGGVGIAFTTDYKVVLGLRLLQGIGAAGTVPILIASIGDLYEGATEATAQGLRLTSTGLSQALFPLLAGFLVVIAWQYPFFIYGLSIPIAVLVALWFEEPTSVTDRDGGVTIGQLTRFVAQPHVVALLIIVVTPSFLYFGYLTYISILVSFSGGTPGQAGIAVATTSSVYALAASQAGRITTQFDSRLIPLIGTNLAMGIGLGIVSLSETILIMEIGAAILGIGFGITLTLYRSIATGIATVDSRGSIVGLVESLNRVGGATAPIVIGLIIGLAEPSVGLSTATRWTVFGIGVVGTGIGIFGLLTASTFSPNSNL